MFCLGYLHAKPARRVRFVVWRVLLTWIARLGCGVLVPLVPSRALLWSLCDRGFVGAQRLKEAAEVSRDARTVFVTQLVVRATESDVKKFFEAVGKVNQVQLIKDKITGAELVPVVPDLSIPSLVALSWPPLHCDCTAMVLPLFWQARARASATWSLHNWTVCRKRCC